MSLRTHRTTCDPATLCAALALPSFPLESAVGLESGPYLLFGAGRQRTLRFLPATE